MGSVPVPKTTAPRIQIEHPAPVVDCGRYRVKRSVGQRVDVGVDIFRDGHEALRAVVRWKGPGDDSWAEAPLHPVDAHIKGVRWEGSFGVDRPGRWTWTVEAWSDELASWRVEVERKAAAPQDDLDSELSEGVALLGAAAERASTARHTDDAEVLAATIDAVADATQRTPARVAAGLAPEAIAAADRHPGRQRAARMAPSVEVAVDPVRARFGSWYEMFPRSWGGFDGIAAQLPALAELGFDVVYLPPIHPIGVTNRKGRNNGLIAGPDDPGSPWAVGGVEGGHTALLVNAHHDEVAFVLPARRFGREWTLELDTVDPTAEPGAWTAGARGEVAVVARSISILRRTAPLRRTEPPADA